MRESPASEFQSERFLDLTADTSAVILENPLEALPREEDAAFYCAERKIHLLGDFVVLVSLHMH